MSGETHVKVLVKVEPTNDWPELSSEGLWAVALDDGYFQIDNVPFYAVGLSNGDIIAAGTDEQPGLWFQEVVKPSDFSTIRVSVSKDPDKEPARDLFRQLGCESEGMSAASFALTVPRDRLETILREIEIGKAAGRWQSNEGVIRR